MTNSDIDFPLLTSQFKDLNLQLHASTTVTNPYTFSIQGNKSFSAQLEPEVVTYQITCGTSYIVRPFQAEAIGYSKIGFLNNTQSFGSLAPGNFKGNLVLGIIYAEGEAHGFPFWQVIVDGDVGETVTLKTGNISISLSKATGTDGNYFYTFQLTNLSVAPTWKAGNSYKLTLF